eukprot:11456593-Ditylum_brightwellii.AAC.1
MGQKETRSTRIATSSRGTSHEGHLIDDFVLAGGRANNSQGGKELNDTSFNECWKACKEVILPEAGAEERRNSEVMYASLAHSIPNLLLQTTEILQHKIDSGDLDKMPPIPTMEW